MLDPLIALGIASSVIQIIDFGCKLVSETQQIYHVAKGATKDNVTFREITEDIIILDTNLSRQNQNNQRLSPDDIVLGNLADSCALGLLVELAVQPDATQWKSFKKAIKSARKKEKVGDIEKRLLKIQGQINYRLQVMMTYVLIDLLDSTNISALATNNLNCQSDWMTSQRNIQGCSSRAFTIWSS